MRDINQPGDCPCGSHQLYNQCCFPIITGKRLAQTPEELMRSRYTAYRDANIDYLLSSMSGKARATADPQAMLEWANQTIWLDLKIIKTQMIGKHKGLVEFIAVYEKDEVEQRLHEKSFFVRDNERWYYVDGEHPRPPALQPMPVKVGRNTLCPCGSGRKYKKCCLLKNN